jgi:hypothetical protein
MAITAEATSDHEQQPAPGQAVTVQLAVQGWAVTRPGPRQPARRPLRPGRLTSRRFRPNHLPASTSKGAHVSALFDRENPPRRHPRDDDDDTAEIPVPATTDPDQPDDADDGDFSAADHARGRLRPTTRTRRLKASLLLGAYTLASLGSAWLAVLAFLRLNAIVMVMMIAAAMWLGRDAVRLARWLGHLDHGTQPGPRASNASSPACWPPCTSGCSSTGCCTSSPDLPLLLAGKRTTSRQLPCHTFPEAPHALPRPPPPARRHRPAPGR